MFSMDLCHSKGQVLIAVGNLEFGIHSHASHTAVWHVG